MRTTSSVEALNSTVQKTFPDLPNIYTFVQNLRLFDSIKSTDLHQLTLPTTSEVKAKMRRLKDHHRDEKILLCSQSLSNKDITILEFLYLMANLKIRLPTDGKFRFLNTNKLFISLLIVLFYVPYSEKYVAQNQ